MWLAVMAIASNRVRRWLLDGVLWLALAGLTFSSGLMYVQFFILHAFCPLCTGSAVTVGALLVTTLRARRMVATVSPGASPAGALTLGLFAALSILIFSADNLVTKKPAGGFLVMDLPTAHRKGPANAPVQIIVFSDFQCGFCRQLAPVLQKVEGEFSQQVAIVYRHFPLAGHSRAFPAAVAAECAAEQGAFWPYHDQLFAEGGNLDDARLLELASSLGLDRQRFNACLRSDGPRQMVEANLREATELGLPGAPSLFLNGRLIEGPLTYENLTKRIRESLRTPLQTARPPH
jgi:predicted DsbA family dithiol-disulfide isomerase